MSTGILALASNEVQPRARAIKAYAPGLLLCLGGAAVAMIFSSFIPGLRAMIVAIIAGIALTNMTKLPSTFSPGIQVAAKTLLRWGIVFLGLKLVIADVRSLGLPMLLVIVCIVSGGIIGTLLIGRLLKMKPAQVLLIACGFSICGAAAVAGVRGASDAEEEDVVIAVALVVIFGTIMIPTIPFLGALAGLAPETMGMWAGGSIHEVAQVVAAGGAIGGSALEIAVVVKLARVLMLAPVVFILSLVKRRRSSGVQITGHEKRPPIVPLFIIGFLSMVLLRSTVDLPEPVLATGDFLQTILLATAMFALGCGVKIQSLLHVGVRPFVLAFASTVLVATIAFVGIELV
ncbi:membrane protein [Corynebacterium stationis]|uniref:YeiH family protein n=1 Tax=Corynebacterium stationis TaxID=1705 RepID=UPI000950B164|nr:YeiH family protein [Corynebacterium stationis]APT93928.1 membrane protein [Corynebacterium stationis]